MPLLVQMLEEGKSNGTTNRGITSVLAQHAAPSPPEQSIAFPSTAVSEQSCTPSSQTSVHLNSVGCSIYPTDTDPSLAVEETCCTLEEGEAGFGDGIWCT